MAEGLLGMQPQMINICAQVSIPLILIIFDKLEASRYQGQKRHPNYVGTSLPSHPLPIARIIKRKNKIFTKGGRGLTPKKQDKLHNQVIQYWRSPSLSHKKSSQSVVGKEFHHLICK
jgi:hypothetical protein